jgi:hypothetical protein
LQQLKKEMISPSHGTFVTSTIVFVLTLAWILHNRQEDKLQDHFLFGGGFIGVILGMLTGFDTQGIMLSMMPGAVLVAVILSIMLHEIWGQSNSLIDGNGDEGRKNRCIIMLDALIEIKMALNHRRGQDTSAL